MYACFCLSCENCIHFGNTHISCCSPIKIIIIIMRFGLSVLRSLTVPRRPANGKLYQFECYKSTKCCYCFCFSTDYGCVRLHWQCRRGLSCCCQSLSAPTRLSLCSPTATTFNGLTPHSSMVGNKTNWQYSRNCLERCPIHYKKVFS